VNLLERAKQIRGGSMIYSQLMNYLGDRLGERVKMRRRGLHKILDTS
jgi:hypothetical protein